MPSSPSDPEQRHGITGRVTADVLLLVPPARFDRVEVGRVRREVDHAHPVRSAERDARDVAPVASATPEVVRRSELTCRRALEPYEDRLELTQQDARAVAATLFLRRHAALATDLPHPALHRCFANGESARETGVPTFARLVRVN